MNYKLGVRGLGFRCPPETPGKKRMLCFVWAYDLWNIGALFRGRFGPHPYYSELLRSNLWHAQEGWHQERAAPYPMTGQLLSLLHESSSCSSEFLEFTTMNSFGRYRSWASAVG